MLCCSLPDGTGRISEYNSIKRCPVDNYIIAFILLSDPANNKKTRKRHSTRHCYVPQVSGGIWLFSTQWWLRGRGSHRFKMLFLTHISHCLRTSREAAQRQIEKQNRRMQHQQKKHFRAEIPVSFPCDPLHGWHVTTFSHYCQQNTNHPDLDRAPSSKVVPSSFLPRASHCTLTCTANCNHQRQAREHNCDASWCATGRYDTQRVQS